MKIAWAANLLFDLRTKPVIDTFLFNVLQQDYDVLLISGPITTDGRHTQEYIQQILDAAYPLTVLFVLGKQDYYEKYVFNTIYDYKCTDLENGVCLDACKGIVCGNIAFIGSTGWGDLTIGKITTKVQDEIMKLPEVNELAAFKGFELRKVMQIMARYGYHAAGILADQCEHVFSYNQKIERVVVLTSIPPYDFMISPPHMRTPYNIWGYGGKFLEHMDIPVTVFSAGYINYVKHTIGKSNFLSYGFMKQSIPLFYSFVEGKSDKPQTSTGARYVKSKKPLQITTDAGKVKA